VEYLNEGRVRELGISGSIANAIVRGTRNYVVRIDLDHDLSSTCTCPYDFEGYCKHIVATLLALSKGYEGIVKSSEAEEDEINRVLRNMDVGQLRDFLKKESRDKTIKRNLLIFATGETKAGGRSVDEYKKDISELYDASDDDDGYIEVEFSEFVDLAERCMKKNNFTEAANVYQALSEVIAENMDSFDDSDGYYGDRFWEAIRGLSSCVNSMRPDEKLGYISYLFQRFTKMEPDYFQEGYDEALRLVCTGRDDLQQLVKLLSPRLPRSSLADSKKGNWDRYYESRIILDMQAFALDGLASLGDVESRRELYELLQRYRFHDEEFCLLYSERLAKDGRVDEAVKIAEEGLRKFPTRLTTELRLFLSKHYEMLSPEKYRENLKILFFEELDWGYYEKLRKVSGEQWNSMLQEMLKHFSSHARREYDDDDDVDGTILIEIYVREKMFDSALKEVLARRSLRVLSRYYKHLAKSYPEEYFNAYKEVLLPYADSRMGRDYYHEVALQLKKMKAIRGFERASREYIEMLRHRYAGRPAFLDEIKGL
jgi:uncharacterized Zn finger protein